MLPLLVQHGPLLPIQTRCAGSVAEGRYAFLCVSLFRAAMTAADDLARNSLLDCVRRVRFATGGTGAA